MSCQYRFCVFSPFSIGGVRFQDGPLERCGRRPNTATTISNMHKSIRQSWTKNKQTDNRISLIFNFSLAFVSVLVSCKSSRSEASSVVAVWCVACIYFVRLQYFDDKQSFMHTHQNESGNGNIMITCRPVCDLLLEYNMCFVEMVANLHARATHKKKEKRKKRNEVM